MSKVRYKYCVVPGCKSTTTKTPKKLFFSIPTGEVRKKWCEVMGRDAANCKTLSAKCNRFCCEDHFTLDKDMENYTQWQLVGSKKLILKKGVLPHKFECQRGKSDSQTTETKNDALDTQETSEQKQGLRRSKRKKAPNKSRKKVKKRPNSKMILSTSEEEEEEEIDEQMKKIEKLSQLTQDSDSDQQQSEEMEKYTFNIKVEADEDTELNDTILEEYEIHDYNSANQGANQIGDIEVKVEELDEEFEPVVVEQEPEILDMSDETDKERSDKIEKLLLVYESDHSAEFAM